MATTPLAEQPQRSLGQRLAPVLVVAVLGLAAALLYNALRRYSLIEIAEAMRAIPLRHLLLAGCFAAASYLCLTGFDFLATRYAGHRLPYRRVALTSFVSLSIGHTLGFAALSTGAIRYRFYARYGLALGDIAKVILFCGLTVGLGITALGGAALLLAPALAAETTGIPPQALRVLGAGCVAVALGYLGLAAVLRRPLRIRGWSIAMPTPRLAAAQLVIGPLNFACVAACLHQVLSAAAELSYLKVAAVYVVGLVTALISHVPGGLGVLESVVLFLLGGELIGALLMFRAIYFLVPLCLGTALFALAELIWRQSRAAGAQDGSAAARRG
jgi:glycosyltransferase 2 family protein